MAGSEPDDPEATLAAWRAGGADHADPVQFRFLEALARRAARHQGAVRRLLDARVARGLQAYGLALREPPPPPTRAGTGPSGRLAALVDAVARTRPVTAEPELSTLREFRADWSRLRVDQRLGASRAGLPAHAGPLNSQHLVHRALSLMRDVSPGYLERFLTHTETLLWLDALSGAPAPERAGGATRRRRRRTPGGT